MGYCDKSPVKKQACRVLSGCFMAAQLQLQTRGFKSLELGLAV